MELRGGNEVDGDMVARLDARGGADGGENGAGQDRNTRVVLLLVASGWRHCGAAGAVGGTG